MIQIPITQFIRPNGTPRQVTTDMPDHLKPQWDEIQKVGLRLTAEVLLTQEVSLTLEEPDLGDYAIQVVANGPEVPKAVEQMIINFTAEGFERWMSEKLSNKVSSK